MMKSKFLLSLLTLWSFSAAAQDVKGSIDYADGIYQYVCRVKKAPSQYELIIDLPGPNGVLERVHEGAVLVTGQVAPGSELKVTVYQSALKQGRWATDRTSFVEASHRTGNEGPTYYHEGNLAKLAEPERSSNFSAEMATLKPSQAIRLTVEYFIINYSRAIPNQAQKEVAKQTATQANQKASTTDLTEAKPVKVADAAPQEAVASTDAKAGTGTPTTSDQPDKKAEVASQDKVAADQAPQAKVAQEAVATTNPDITTGTQVNQKATETKSTDQAKVGANEPTGDQPGKKTEDNHQDKTTSQAAEQAAKANPAQGAPQEAVASLNAKVLPGEALTSGQSAQNQTAANSLLSQVSTGAVESKKEEKTPVAVAATTPANQEPNKGFPSGSGTQTGGFIDQLERSDDNKTGPKPEAAAQEAASETPKPGTSEPAPDNATSQASPEKVTILAPLPTPMAKADTATEQQAKIEEVKPATPMMPTMPASKAQLKDSVQSQAQPSPDQTSAQPAAEAAGTVANQPAIEVAEPKKAALALDNQQFDFAATQTLKIGSETYFVVPNPDDNKQGRFYFKLEHYMRDSARTENRYNSYFILHDSLATANKYEVRLYLSIEDKYGQVQGYPSCYLNCSVDLAEGVVRYLPTSKMKDYRDPAAPEQEPLTNLTGQISRNQITELAFRHLIAHYAKLFSN